MGGGGPVLLLLEVVGQLPQLVPVLQRTTTDTTTLSPPADGMLAALLRGAGKGLGAASVTPLP